MIEFTLDRRLWCPWVFCDHCGERIETAQDGNVHYKILDPLPRFTHKRCLLPFENSHGGPAQWFCEELETFMLRLAINLDMAQDEGQDGMFTKVVIRGKLVAGV